MKQLAIISGKGGTGKTTVVASLARLAAPAVTVDADVDASNLALLLPGEDSPARAFFAGQRAEVDPEICAGCGVCAQVCRFGALELDREGCARVDRLACEGCAACHLVCPIGAVELRPNQAGTWTVRETELGPLVHARLGVAQDNSGKLVARVREEAREQAAARGLDLVLIDGPPGIGCPVHAAVTGVDLILAVTEPTPSGEHDLQRVLELAEMFGLQVAVLINKADLSESYTCTIEQRVRAAGATVVGRLPFDPQVPRLLARGQVPLALAPLADELGRVWSELRHLLQQGAVAAAPQPRREGAAGA